MNKIVFAISELLKLYECVLIPGFGAFIAMHKSAEKQSAGFITPPSKSFTFNKHLKQNDGLLIAKIAQVDASTFKTAARNLNSCVADWNEQLKNGDRILLDGIGFFVKNSEGNLHFECDKHANFSLISFGLIPIRFSDMHDVSEVNSLNNVEVDSTNFVSTKQLENLQILVAEEKRSLTYNPQFDLAFQTNEIKEVATEKFPATLPKDKEKSLKIGKIVRYAAAAVLIPLGFYTYWIPTHSNVLQSGVITLNNFNPFAKPTIDQKNNPKERIIQHKKAGKATSNLEPTDLAKPKVSGKLIQSNLDQNNTNTNTFEKPIEHDAKTDIKGVLKMNNTKTVNSNAKFLLIAGSFSSKENAQKLVNSLILEGFDKSGIENINNMFRVYALASNNIEEVQTSIEQLNSKNLNSWILRK